jgi:hypothetical protein
VVDIGGRCAYVGHEPHSATRSLALQSDRPARSLYACAGLEMQPEIPTDPRGQRGGDRWLEPHGGALLFVLGIGLIVAGFAIDRGDAFAATVVVFGGLISALGAVLPRAEGPISLTATGILICRSK